MTTVHYQIIVLSIVKMYSKSNNWPWFDSLEYLTWNDSSCENWKCFVEFYVLDLQTPLNKTIEFCYLMCFGTISLIAFSIWNMFIKFSSHWVLCPLHQILKKFCYCLQKELYDIINLLFDEFDLFLSILYHH